MEYVTIHLKNDPRTINMQIKLFEKHQSSPIYAYWLTNQDKIELDIDYDSMITIIAVLKNKISYQCVSKKIKSLLDKFCLVDETIVIIEDILKQKFNNIFSKIIKFVNNDRPCVTFPEKSYLEYKQIFANKWNIIPIQVIMFKDSIACLSIYEGLPIYREDKTNKKINVKISDASNDDIIDIIKTRYSMFYKHNGAIESESSSESDDDISGSITQECGPEYYRDQICEDVTTDIFLKRVLDTVQSQYELIQETPCNYKGSKLLSEETSQLIKKNIDNIISKVIDEIPNFDFGGRNATMRLAYGFVNVI